MDKWDPNWNKTFEASRDNYWAGAKKACDDLGMSLPDKSKLESISIASQEDSSLGLPTSGAFWSSSEYNKYFAYEVYFFGGWAPKNESKGYNDKVLCVGD